MRYDVTATREGRWWVIDVEGVGVTQSRNLADAERWARSLVAVMKQVPEDTVRVDVRVVLPAPVEAQLKDARAHLAAAEAARRKAADESRLVVKRLRALGLTGRDVAKVMGVSPQRVSQLGKAS